MRAVGFRKSLPITHEESFIDFEKDNPVPSGYDLLIKVNAISVNPVDFKIRQSAARDIVLEEPKIIGWDAVGTVEAVGEMVTLFDLGDKVYYAGDLTRDGSNAEYQLVDERIVGRKPNTLTDAEAAAIPLTALTAWESLFDRIGIDPERDKGKTVLMLAGAGGVGSIAIQIAKKVAGLKVIATASRQESKEWCIHMGADHVVNHYNLISDLESIGIQEVDYILDFVDINSYWETAIEIIKPQGHIVSITGNSNPLDLSLLKRKSISFSFEFMYTRSMFQTDDIKEQHHILNKVADFLDDGTFKTSLTTTLKGLSSENLKKAHALQESGKTIGKTVIVF